MHHEEVGENCLFSLNVHGQKTIYSQRQTVFNGQNLKTTIMMGSTGEIMLMDSAL